MVAALGTNEMIDLTRTDKKNRNRKEENGINTNSNKTKGRVDKHKDATPRLEGTGSVNTYNNCHDYGKNADYDSWTIRKDERKSEEENDL